MLFVFNLFQNSQMPFFENCITQCLWKLACHELRSELIVLNLFCSSEVFSKLGFSVL